MKGVLAFAAILLASSTAQAQYTFDYGGRTIRIDPDRGKVSIPGVYDNTGPRSKRSHNDHDVDRAQKRPPRPAKMDPQPLDAGVAKTEPAPAPVSPPPSPSTDTADVAPADTSMPTPPPASTPAPQVQQETDPAATPAPVPAPVIAAAPPQPMPPETSSAPSPLGLWLTEEEEGKVRIEPCGPNLCGYSVGAKSDQNGEEVLINMKLGDDSKWHGRIHDPNTGSNYDSTIALKGASFLRVQACAFGAMFCGGQTWSRLN
jgi:uncharacterized protein (DUF2147 family)